MPNSGRGIASRTRAHDPATLLFLVQCFGAAKLDLGEELRDVVEHLLEEVGEALPPGAADKRTPCYDHEYGHIARGGRLGPAGARPASARGAV